MENAAYSNWCQATTAHKCVTNPVISLLHENLLLGSCITGSFYKARLRGNCSEIPQPPPGQRETLSCPAAGVSKPVNMGISRILVLIFQISNLKKIKKKKIRISTEVLDPK